MEAEQAISIITDMVATVGTVLMGGLGLVLTLVAVLIGLFFVVRLVQRKVGRGR